MQREIKADLQVHLAERIDNLIARGMDPAGAARRARQELGDAGKWLASWCSPSPSRC
jgi:hypothetical protein